MDGWGVKRRDITLYHERRRYGKMSLVDVSVSTLDVVYYLLYDVLTLSFDVCSHV